MKRAIAVKLQFWRGQRTKIGHHGGLAMGQDRDPVEFCDGQSDWRCSAGVWRRVGWLPHFNDSSILPTGREAAVLKIRSRRANIMARWLGSNASNADLIAGL